MRILRLCHWRFQNRQIYFTTNISIRKWEERESWYSHFPFSRPVSKSIYPVADPRGSAGNTRPLSRSNFFHFYAVFGKKSCQIIGWRPPSSWRWRSPRKSWIRYCDTLLGYNIAMNTCFRIHRQKQPYSHHGFAHIQQQPWVRYWPFYLLPHNVHQQAPDVLLLCEETFSTLHQDVQVLGEIVEVFVALNIWTNNTGIWVQI